MQIVFKNSLKADKLIFKSEKHNIFTEETNKIALSSNDNKRMKSIFSIDTYARRISNDQACKKEEIKQSI